jgi:hypothetical protein
MEGEDMKVKTIVPAIAILLLTSLPVQARKNSRQFVLQITVTMNGVEIPAGLYDLSWEPERPGVRVNLWKNGRFFATAKGDWVKNGVKYTGDAALLRVNSDGSRSLVEIRLAGVKKTIVLETIEPILRLSAK